MRRDGGLADGCRGHLGVRHAVGRLHAGSGHEVIRDCLPTLRGDQGQNGGVHFMSLRIRATMLGRSARLGRGDQVHLTPLRGDQGHNVGVQSVFASPCYLRAAPTCIEPETSITSTTSLAPEAAEAYLRGCGPFNHTPR